MFVNPLKQANVSPVAIIKLANNVAVSTTTYANVTGMSFTMAADSTYVVELYGVYKSAASTTGLALAFDVPTDVTIVGFFMANSSATTRQSIEQVADAVAASVTTSTRDTDVNTPVNGHWIIKTVTAGTAQLTMRSEIDTSAVTMQGGLSYMKVMSI